MVQLLFTLLCVILEITEYSAFTDFNDELTIPVSAYFGAEVIRRNNIVYFNGVKVYYYIVILMTLFDSAFYVFRYGKFHVGPYRRDISINGFFAMLWITSGFTNIYPTFNGLERNCANSDLNQTLTHTDAFTRECKSWLASISFGWVIATLFLFTTGLAWKLWCERRELYEGERRVEALDEVVYRPASGMVQLGMPDQVVLQKGIPKDGVPIYYVVTAPS